MSKTHGSNQESTTEQSTDTSEDATGRSREPTTYVQWGGLIALLLLALIALVRFYASATEAISIWITQEYVPIFQAGFNLVVLLLAAIGISLLVRQLSR